MKANKHLWIGLVIFLVLLPGRANFGQAQKGNGVAYKAKPIKPHGLPAAAPQKAEDGWPQSKPQGEGWVIKTFRFRAVFVGAHLDNPMKEAPYTIWVFRILGSSRPAKYFEFGGYSEVPDDLAKSLIDYNYSRSPLKPKGELQYDFTVDAERVYDPRTDSRLFEYSSAQWKNMAEPMDGTYLIGHIRHAELINAHK